MVQPTCSVRIIGIDCATQPEKTGIAVAEYRDESLELTELFRGKRGTNVSKSVAGFLNHDSPVLLALDAPLGWPIALGRGLAHHEAGLSLVGERGTLFWRHTDRIVKNILSKKPLAVGADKIAHTAHAALEMLNELRGLTNQPIPLAWSRGDVDKASISAIEVYPAATRRARELSHEASRITKSDPPKGPTDIVEELLKGFGAEEHGNDIEENVHVRDAVVCALAASDFLSGQCIRPDDRELARKEGWIWFREPKTL